MFIGLEHKSIRDNILFGNALDEERYEQVLTCCSQTRPGDLGGRRSYRDRRSQRLFKWWPSKHCWSVIVVELDTQLSPALLFTSASVATFIAAIVTVAVILPPFLFPAAFIGKRWET